MIRAESLRRAAVFLVLFGGGVGFLVWRAGGVTGGNGGSVVPAGTTDGTGETGDDPAVVIDEGASLAGGKGAQVVHDAVEVIDGRRVVYRQWEARWARSTPLASDDPEETALEAETCSLLFYPRPTEEDPRPRAVEDDGTTRVDANLAEVRYREGRKPRAVLRDNVRLTRWLEDGAVSLTTDDLVCDGQTRQVETASRVTVRHTGAELEGTGLAGDLDLRSLELQADVTGRFRAERRAFSPSGEGNEEVVTTITCSGPARVEAVEEAPARRRTGAQRWLMVFQGDVVVTQPDSELRCDRLKVEFRTGGGDVPASGADGDPLRDVIGVLADGHVTSRSSRGGEDLRASADRLTHTREEGDVEVVAFEGRPRFTFTPADGGGRLEIEAAGDATLRTSPHRDPARRGHRRLVAVFRDEVTARRMPPGSPDVGGEPEAEILAPKVTLFALEPPEGAVEVDTITAEGGVRMRHMSFRAQSRAASWRLGRELPDLRTPDTISLSGRPVLSMDGSDEANPFGTGRRTDSRMQLDSAGDIDVRVYVDRAEARDPPDGEPWAHMKAMGGATLQEFVGETVVLALRSDELVATAHRDTGLQRLDAFGNARLEGRSDPEPRGVPRTEPRRAVARGNRIVVARAPAAAVGEDPTARVFVVGAATSPAVGLVTEPSGRRHEIRALRLWYEQDGQRLVAEHQAEGVLAIGETHPAGRARIHADRLTARLSERAQVAGGAADAPHLLGISAEGNARMTGSTEDGTRRTEVTGDLLEYDHEGRRINVNGGDTVPARVRVIEDGGLESSVVSDRVRVFLAGADEDDEGLLRVRRASCAGGTVSRALPPDDGESAPRRVVLDCTGPIEVEQGRAGAQGDVRLRLERRVETAGRWDADMRLRCDVLEMEFDTEADQVALRDRVRRVVARSSGTDPVRISAEKYTATCASAEILAQHQEVLLESASGTPVEVHEMDPPRSFRCDRGRWNFQTYEWTETLRLRWIEGGG